MAEIPEGFGGTPDQVARAVALLKALSHEGRLQILCLLVDADLSVSQLSEALGTSPAGISQQLMRLRAEGIVQARRDGKSVIYQLSRNEVAAITSTLRDTFCRRQHPGPEAQPPEDRARS